MAEVKLPKVGRVVRTQRKPLRMVLYGAIGVGKTTFATGFNDPIMFNTDGNILDTDVPGFTINRFSYPNAAEIKKIKEEGGIVPKADTTFERTLNSLIENEGGGFSTVIVDLVNGIYRLCRKETLSAYGAVHEQELGDYGKGYALIREPFYNQIVNKLFSLPLDIILICHEKEKEIKQKNGSVFSYFKPDLEDSVISHLGQFGYVCRAYVDIQETDGETKVVRKLSLSPKPNEVGVVRFRNAKGDPVTVEDIPLNANAFIQLCKDVLDPNKQDLFNIDTVQVAIEENIKNLKSKTRNRLNTVPTKSNDTGAEVTDPTPSKETTSNAKKSNKFADLMKSRKAKVTATEEVTEEVVEETTEENVENVEVVEAEVIVEAEVTETKTKTSEVIDEVSSEEATPVKETAREKLQRLQREKNAKIKSESPAQASTKAKATPSEDEGIDSMLAKNTSTKTITDSKRAALEAAKNKYKAKLGGK